MTALDLGAIPQEEIKAKKSWIKDGNFKVPNGKVQINKENHYMFLYWIHERQQIWYRRNILEEPAPWTEDEILQSYRFTHPIRDLDKVTVYYIDNLLSQLEDTEQSKKNLLFNTVIFRLFTNPKAWELIGYLDLETINIEEEIERVLRELAAYQKAGNSVFTGSYMVNPMNVIRNHYGGVMSTLEEGVKSNKVENAMYVVKYVYDNFDTIYKSAISECDSMKQQLEYFKSLPGIGRFNAYEWACDLCLAERYTGIPMVKWDDNSDTSVGPGCSRGLKYMFDDLGNLTEKQALFLLASTIDYYFDEYGFTETMKWPGDVKEFNLRVVEHSLIK